LLSSYYNGNNIAVYEVVSFHITTNKFNYRHYRNLRDAFGQGAYKTNVDRSIQ